MGREGGVFFLSSLLFGVFRVSASQASLALLERSVVGAPDHRAGWFGLWRERDLSRTARRLSVWIRNNKNREAELEGGQNCAGGTVSEAEERGQDPGPSSRG